MQPRSVPGAQLVARASVGKKLRHANPPPPTSSEAQPVRISNPLLVQGSEAMSVLSGEIAAPPTPHFPP